MNEHRTKVSLLETWLIRRQERDERSVQTLVEPIPTGLIGPKAGTHTWVSVYFIPRYLTVPYAEFYDPAPQVFS